MTISLSIFSGISKLKLRKHAFAIIESDSHFKIFNSKFLKSILDQHLGAVEISLHGRLEASKER
jgi:hypothetical protein